jgi:hypothetical protein
VEKKRNMKKRDSEDAIHFLSFSLFSSRLDKYVGGRCGVHSQCPMPVSLNLED